MKILVYVDGSDASMRAIDRAIELANDGNQITALHVSPPRLDRDQISQFEIEPENWDAAFAQDVLDKVRKKFEKADLTVETLAVEGPVVEVIREFAESGAYDVVLIGGRDTTAGRLFDLSEIVRQTTPEIKVEVVH
jgi:nucleotide-binding universal stress UspA family protein